MIRSCNALRMIAPPRRYFPLSEYTLFLHQYTSSQIDVKNNMIAIAAPVKSKNICKLSGPLKFVNR